MKYLAIILLFISYHAKATSWAAAMPYTKTYDYQDVLVKAIAYQPYDPYPEGKTEVYKKGKLLYTIDRYIRDDVFVSKDGIWFAVIDAGYFYYVDEIKNHYDYPMVTIFKNGKFFKNYLIKDLIDTNIRIDKFILYDSEYTRGWNRSLVLETTWDCEYCIKEYGSNLSICDTATDITEIEDCIECKQKCDSLKMINNEMHLTNNSSYMKDNILHLLTSYNTVIKIDFNNDCALTKHPFSSVIPNKYNFNPPCVSTIYDEIIMPDKFDMPKLKSGIAFKDALADYLGYKSGSADKTEELTFIFQKLVINTNGHCEELDFNIWNENIIKYKALYNKQSERTFLQKVYNWVMVQEYDTSLIPRGYDKYYFYSFVHVH